jgi:hypothetical protein
VRDGGANGLRVAHDAVKGTVARATEMETAIATAAQRAMRGVMEAAHETGGSTGETTQAAAQGTLEAAGTRSRAAVDAVTDVMVGVVAGVTDVLGAMLPRGAWPTASGPSSSPQSTGPALTQQQDTQGSPAHAAYWVQGSTPMITAIHTAVKGRARYKVTELYGSVPLKRLFEVRLVAQYAHGQCPRPFSS